MPKVTEMENAYPNPFNPNTFISYHVYWHGKHENGNIAPTGTYLIRMQTENNVQVQKVLLMK